MATIRCRAQVSEACYHGRPEFEVYDKEGPGQREDGSWDQRTGSVVCDPCYIELGTPPSHFLEAAIRLAHRSLNARDERQGL